MGNEFPIVGIGASAGGVEALEGFFSGMPAQPGFACVIVTHLNPERESLLHEIVARYTHMPVHIAEDGMAVEPDCVYVLPANAILSIEKRNLLVRKPDSTRRERKPIDIFFSALAADQGEMAAGVVLSGGDGDGTLGIKALKEQGGLTLAQVDGGHGPQYPDMPESAISTGLVDFALPAREMGAKLAEYARSLPMLDRPTEQTGADNDAVDDVRHEIYAILLNQIGHDFTGYKTRTFMRRVQRRMHIRQLVQVDAYVAMLRQEPQEVSALFRDLLISVTNFFRDPEAFDSLAHIVMPALFAGRGAGNTIRIWVPGCATGEEVFSIAMLLREHMDGLIAVPRVQVFATDIDAHALGIARAARYPASLLEGVSPERRRRFFVKDGSSYVVAKEVRDLCIFSPHSVIRDPPFSRIDLVSCRNLLIYFGRDLQRQVIPVFHYALRPEGFLFLGVSENISQFVDLFTPIETGQRVFRKREDAGSPIRLPLVLAGLRPSHITGGNSQGQRVAGITLRQTIETQVLEQFAPPYVVANREGDVIFYSARTGKYLEAAAGSPTRQILAIARKGLRLDLRTALREVVETGNPLVRESVAIEGDDGRIQLIDLMVTPAEQREPDSEPLYLVVFIDRGPSLSREEALTKTQLKGDGTLAHLERELQETRERLQSLIEEYETALEELKSSNEELVSVNEELQSSNEELEASKEELQSVNEELHTVNIDLNNKIDALDRAHSDLQNLFENNGVASVFLDRQLAIRSFTPAVSNVFNILPSDQGRPITDLSNRFNLFDFAEDIAKVVEDGSPIERRSEHSDGKRHFLVRFNAYRDSGQNVDGVVVTFVDVTTLTQAEVAQTLLIAELQHRTRNLLSVVQSITTQTLAKGGSVASFSARLSALGRVQSLISHSSTTPVMLGEIVRLELQAHGVESSPQVAVTGPDVALQAEQLQLFALALHELANNAVEHGALTGDTGRLKISWSLDEDSAGNAPPSVTLDWVESGVAMPLEAPKRGYGRKLIEQALKFSLNARTDLVFTGDGVSCRIQLPIMVRPEGSNQTIQAW